MIDDLVQLFGLGPRELVAFTGGGGKSTLLLGLSKQLAERGSRVLVTTTTKLSLDQTAGATICWTTAGPQLAAALDARGPVFVLSEADDHKVIGFGPETVDEMFSHSPADYVLVEADGARGRPLKAPAAHEPVVPVTTSLVVVVFGVDAIGATFAQAAHRPETAAALAGTVESDVITPQTVAAILTHPEGGLQRIPASARVVVAITKVAPENQPAAAATRDLIASSPRVERVVTVPFQR